MEYHGIKMIGDFETDNIKAKDGNGIIIEDDAGNRALTIYDLGSIKALYGTAINEFSIDGTLAGDSDSALPTEKAVKAYVASYAQPLSEDLTDIDNLTPGTNYFIVGDGADWVTKDGLNARTALGCGTVATFNYESSVSGLSTVIPTSEAVLDYCTTYFLQTSNNLSEVNAVSARANLGLDGLTNDTHLHNQQYLIFRTILADDAGTAVADLYNDTLTISGATAGIETSLEAADNIGIGLSSILVNFHNLGVPTDNDFIVGSAGLWTKVSPALARTAMGLGTAAQKNYAGTVASNSDLPTNQAVINYLSSYNGYGKAYSRDDDSESAAGSPNDTLYFQTGIGLSTSVTSATDTVNIELSTNLQTISELEPTSGQFIYSESSAWVIKTTAQVKTILGISNLNSFGIVASADGSTVTAAAPYSTLNVNYGTGISTTCNNVTKTLTLSLDNDLAVISGLTPSDSNVIIGDGTNWTAADIGNYIPSPQSQEFTASGTWAVPENVEWISLLLVGGGGGGQGGYLTQGDAGGGGECKYLSRVKVTPLQTASISIGAGGLGYLSNVTAQDGTDSYFYSTDTGYIYARGGGGAPTAGPAGAGGGAGGGYGAASDSFSSTSKDWNIKTGIGFGGGAGGNGAGDGCIGGACTSIGAIDGRPGDGVASGGGS